MVLLRVGRRQRPLEVVEHGHEIDGPARHAPESPPQQPAAQRASESSRTPPWSASRDRGTHPSLSQGRQGRVGTSATGGEEGVSGSLSVFGCRRPPPRSPQRAVSSQGITSAPRPRPRRQRLPLRRRRTIGRRAILDCAAACWYICSETLWNACCSASVLDLIASASSPSSAARTSLIAFSISDFAAGVDLVAQLAELLLGLVGGVVRVVARLRQLALARVVGRVRLGVLDHLVDVLVGQARAGLDLDLLLGPGAEVLGRDVQDAVGVDVERDLDLRDATRRRRNAGQLELAQRLVVARPSRARPAGRAPRPTAGCPRPSRRSPTCASGSSCCARSGA